MSSAQGKGGQVEGKDGFPLGRFQPVQVQFGQFHKVPRGGKRSAGQLPPKSVDAMTAALGELAADAELRRRLGQTGRERFNEQFRHETMTRQIREVYETLIR